MWYKGQRRFIRLANERDIPIKIPEGVLAGVYANQMVVRHSREEFILDFITLTPPEGVVTARVIVSPGHLKRMIAALSENLARYEKSYGSVEPSEAPPDPRFTN